MGVSSAETRWWGFEGAGFLDDDVDRTLIEYLTWIEGMRLVVRRWWCGEVISITTY